MSHSISQHAHALRVGAVGLLVAVLMGAGLVSAPSASAKWETVYGDSSGVKVQQCKVKRKNGVIKVWTRVNNRKGKTQVTAEANRRSKTGTDLAAVKVTAKPGKISKKKALKLTKKQRKAGQTVGFEVNGSRGWLPLGAMPRC